MFCANCGAKVEDGAKFCPKCGAAVGETQAAGAAASENGSQAGAVVSKEAEAGNNQAATPIAATSVAPAPAPSRGMVFS